MRDAQVVIANPEETSTRGLLVPFSSIATDDNAVRVERAEELFAAFEREHGEEGSHYQNVSELISYFMHWCDSNGFAWPGVLRTAATMHRRNCKA
jgi:hypothetical protein